MKNKIPLHKKVPSQANLAKIKQKNDQCDKKKQLKRNINENKNNNQGKKSKQNEQMMTELTNITNQIENITNKLKTFESKAQINMKYQFDNQGELEQQQKNQQVNQQFKKRQLNQAYQPKQISSKEPEIQQIIQTQEEQIELFVCKEGCGRKFNKYSLAKHEAVCKKVFQTKRAVFQWDKKKPLDGQIQQN